MALGRRLGVYGSVLQTLLAACFSSARMHSVLRAIDRLIDRRFVCFSVLISLFCSFVRLIGQSVDPSFYSFDPLAWYKTIDH